MYSHLYPYPRPRVWSVTQSHSLTQPLTQSVTHTQKNTLLLNERIWIQQTENWHQILVFFNNWFGFFSKFFKASSIFLLGFFYPFFFKLKEMFRLSFPLFLASSYQSFKPFLIHILIIKEWGSNSLRLPIIFLYVNNSLILLPILKIHIFFFGVFFVCVRERVWVWVFWVWVWVWGIKFNPTNQRTTDDG